MARGWESKSVEEQVAAAQETIAGDARPRLTPEQRDQRRKRELLGASRALILQQLQRATNARYRHLLETELASLDSQIAVLDR